MNPTDIGLIIMIAQIIDAVATPIFGILSDNTHTSYGKRLP